MTATSCRELEHRIRAALHDTADGYVPSGDLGRRVRDGARRRARRRIEVQSFAVAAAVLFATFGILVLRSSPTPPTPPPRVMTAPGHTAQGGARVTPPSTLIAGGGAAPGENPLVPQPPPLPPPGVQPADPAGARAGVDAAFATTFAPGSPPESRAAAVERGTVLIPLFQQALEKQGDVVSGTGATVAQVVFTDPAHAAVRYDLVIPVSGTYPYNGTAVLTEGAWKVSHATACDALALALGAITCPP